MPSGHGPTIELLTWAKKVGREAEAKRVKFALISAGVSSRIIETVMGE